MKEAIRKFIQYLPWALLQQYLVVAVYLLAGYWIAIFVFMAFHFPNKFLMALTLVAEAAVLFFYRGFFSLVWMAILHSVIAVLAMSLLPFSITKGMRVLWNYKNENN